MKPKRCRKCGGKMIKGIDMMNSMTRIDDCGNSYLTATMMRVGKAKVVNAIKCSNCGRSVSL